MSRERERNRDYNKNLLVSCRISEARVVQPPPSSGSSSYFAFKDTWTIFLPLKNAHLQHGIVNGLWDILS